MELRTVLGRALRAQCSRVSSTVPRTYISSLYTSQHSIAPLFPCRRSIASSAIRRQDQPKSDSSMAEHLMSALDLKTDSVASTRQNKSHFSSPRAQEEQQSRREGTASHIQPGNSAGDFLQDLMSPPKIRPSGGLGELGKSTSLRPGRAGDTTNLKDLLQPASDIYSALDAQGHTHLRKQNPLPLPLSVRLGPNLGRTVKVNEKRNVDVGRAFRLLDIQCRRNRVSADFRKQLFHERPGLKRKRVNSERWRQTFKEGFKGMIAQVKKMKRQGW